MKTQYLIIMVFVSLLWPGCSDQPPVPATLGDACFDVGQVYCARGIECYPDGAPQHETCVAAWLQACCLDANNCDGDPLIKDGYAWEECLLAFDNFSCQALAEGGIPLECIEASEF